MEPLGVSRIPVHHGAKEVSTQERNTTKIGKSMSFRSLFSFDGNVVHSLPGC